MMSERVRELLNTIDNMLMKQDTYEEAKDSSDLWSVLSALRGPDSGDDRVKDKTTVLIRRAAFPRTTREGRGTPQAVFTGVYDFRPEVLMETVNEAVDHHFESHIAQAALALGILKPIPWSSHYKLADPQPTSLIDDEEAEDNHAEE